MAKDAINIHLVGDKSLRHMFARLPDVMQNKVARKAIVKAAHRMKKPVAVAAPKRTGKLAELIAKAKVRSRARTRRLIRYGWMMPTREELGIPAYTPESPGGYYPTAQEYGFRLMSRKGKFIKMVKPKRYIRGTVDRVTPMHMRLVAIDLRKIIPEARKLAKTKVA